jgi:hypothetical protein
MHEFGEDIGTLRTAFPSLTTVRKRLLFYDLRGKTRHGYLHDVEDVEAILAYRAPQLSPEEREGAAAQLWAAWQRFLGNEDFEDDWLSRARPVIADSGLGQ